MPCVTAGQLQIVGSHPKCTSSNIGAAQLANENILVLRVIVWYMSRLVRLVDLHLQIIVIEFNWEGTKVNEWANK